MTWIHVRCRACDYQAWERAFAPEHTDPSFRECFGCGRKGSLEFTRTEPPEWLEGVSS